MCGNKKVDNSISGSYGAVILAAGYSSRMNAFKPLLPVGELTAIERSIEAVKGAGITNIVVVTGHNRELLTPVIENCAKGSGAADKHSVTEVYNDNYDSGMFSSIKKGIAEAMKNPDAKGVFLLPVDCPLISSEVITRLMQNAGDDDFCVPVFEGKKGHPLYIPQKFFEEICAYDGPGGLKGVTDKYRDKMKRVSVDEEGCVMDMDTPEGYEEIKEFLEAGCRRVPLEELAEGRRIFLIRHGRTRRHEEKMFIGRYDVLLADDAASEIEEMALRIAGEIFDESMDGDKLKIYVSPLRRAKQTAEIIKAAWERNIGSKNSLGERQVELCIIEDFQEISLGSWDGLPVREVKEKYSEEYSERGKDMFAFKIGNRAENFYDVQYRAVKAMRKLLEEDDSRDIVIVTHSAVIRALENNLKRLRVDDEWDGISKSEYKMINA